MLLSNSPEAIYEFIMAYAVENGDDTYYKDDLEYEQVVDKFVKEAWWPVGMPAKVQWVVSVDRQTFQILAMQCPAWERLTMDDVLSVIFQ